MIQQIPYDRIRLPIATIDAIVKAFTINFEPGDTLWIFGSRVNLAAKGGDIDLYIETNNPKADDVISRKFKMVSAIWRSIGERKIDVVINMLSLNYNLPIHNDARQNGSELLSAKAESFRY